MENKKVPLTPRIRKRWTKDDTHITILTAPTVLWYALFCYLPMFGVLLAFINYRVSGGFINSIIHSPWVGFENFKFLFTGSAIRLIIRNTLLYNVVLIACGVVFPVALALVVSELRQKRMAKLYQTLMFFPYFLSWVVVSALVLGFLSYDMGIVNDLFSKVGLERVFWYRETKFWPPFLVLIAQWKGLGNGMILYLAAITSLDKAIFEAAIIDGATKIQQIWYITLPLLKRVIILMLILAVGSLFRSDFGLFFQVPRNSGALFNVVYTIDVYVYQQLISSTIGMASAVALLQSVLSCALILGVNAIVRKLDPDSAMI
ncbi:MAG: ABC transporter permease subunit [Treponema sp.]|jgi:putative aldouronate transport system permease protein|nr:ABC transporter permease subunit [Treponema sp.]